MFNRQPPRRRAESAAPVIGLRRARGSHRQPRRRTRGVLLALALSSTLLVGVAGLFFNPRGADPAVASAANAGPATLMAAGLDPVTPAPAAVATLAAPATQAAAIAGSVVANAVPANSGNGRRVVFSQSAQRVWLVESGGQVRHSYLVSGSVHDNLPPGSYVVFTRARRVTAYDYESQLGYFVGFFRGKNAVIGFHDIPVGNDGKLLQTAAELGTALSSGCVRQNLPDAVKMWEFAPQGTRVVVVA